MKEAWVIVFFGMVALGVITYSYIGLNKGYCSGNITRACMKMVDKDVDKYLKCVKDSKWN